MARNGTRWIGRLQRLGEVGRVADNEVVTLLARVLLYSRFDHTNTTAPRRSSNILSRALHSRAVNVNCVDLGIGISLGAHQSDQSRARTDVGNASCRATRTPRSEQYAVRADFHRARLVVDLELLECEPFARHRAYSLRNPSIPAPNNEKSNRTGSFGSNSRNVAVICSTAFQSLCLRVSKPNARPIFPE